MFIFFIWLAGSGFAADLKGPYLFISSVTENGEVRHARKILQNLDRTAQNDFSKINWEGIEKNIWYPKIAASNEETIIDFSGGGLPQISAQFSIIESKKLEQAGSPVVLTLFRFSGFANAPEASESALTEWKNVEGIRSILVEGEGFLLATEKEGTPIAGKIKITRKKVRAIWNEDDGSGDIIDEYDAAWASIR